MTKWIKHNWVIIVYTLLFLAWVFKFDWISRNILFFLSTKTNVMQRTELYVLAFQHLSIVLISSCISVFIGVGLSIIVRISRLDELKSMLLQFSIMGETFPTVAIIALAVPILGYGNAPLILALSIYGILPIVRNTIVGLSTISKPVQEAAQGLGLSPYQQLLRIDFPLALPTILTGIRIATVINVSVATIGATIGAGGFGVMIIAGIRTYNPLMVIEASIPVILMALWFDRILRIKHD